MKLRTSLAAAGAAVVLGTTGALVLPAVASAHSATHTLKFISVQQKLGHVHQADKPYQDTDVNAAGKTVGFDMIYFAATSATAGAVNVTVDTSGGFLYGTFTINFKTGVFSNGKVTGGNRQLRRSHRNDQGQEPHPAPARRHDHLQRLAKYGSLMGRDGPLRETVPPCWIKINIQTDPLPTVNRGEHFSGIAERIGRTGRHQFTGWVGLMSVIEALTTGSPGGKEQRDVLATQSPVVAAGRGHADVRER